MRFPSWRRRPPQPYYGPPRPRRRRVTMYGAIALLIAAIAGGIHSWGQPTAAQPQPQPQQTTAQAPVSRPATATDAIAGLPADEADALREALRLFDHGPPFPNRHDGDPWSNREGRLPKQARGWYHEFTVRPPPDEDDRGPRRLVYGKDGKIWYTGDHYRTFRQVR
jgi:ribonuclease T1